MRCEMSSASIGPQASNQPQKERRTTMSRPKSPLQSVRIDTGLHCSVADQKRLLGASPYFRSLDEASVAEVQRQFGQQHYPEGATIQLAGQEATRISIVGAGTVKLVRSTSEGRDIVLDMLTPGDHFGSLAQLGDRHYTETAIAHSECCILSTTAPDFARMLRSYPTVAIDSLEMIAARLRDAQGTIEQLSGYSVEQRVVRVLLNLATRIGVEHDGGVLINVPLSRQDLADMTGTTVESASRVMSDLKRQGLIESGRRWIAIPDPTALETRIG